MGLEGRPSRGFELSEDILPGTKVILVDQDNVLADHEGEILRRWRSRYPEYPYVPHENRRNFWMAEDYPEELRAQLRGIFNEKGFIASLPPLPGGLEAIQEMKRAGHIVKICTSPMIVNTNSSKEKQEWVERYLGTDWVRDLIITLDKTVIDGDFLIDDKPEISGAMIPTWEHVVFDKAYNRQVTDKKRITGWANWQDVLQLPVPQETTGIVTARQIPFRT